MDAALVVNLLETDSLDSLMSLARGELMESVIERYAEVTTARRVEAANSYLDSPGQHIYAYNFKEYQLLTNGHSAFFLNSEGKLDVKTTYAPQKDLTAFLYTSQGEEVKVVWMSLHIEIERHRASDNCMQNLYVKVGRVFVNANLLSQARVILGGQNLRVYQKGKKDAIQLESENGKAIILPALLDAQLASEPIDVSVNIPA